MEFDVFLCHNSQDKPAVREMARQLKKLGIEPWLDEWELIPGQSWQEPLEEQIAQIKSAAVFVGGSGLGPWQEREMRAFLNEFVNRGCRVIPVLLNNAPQKPELPIFLRTSTWVDFRQAESKPMERLICGIKGVRPGDLDSIQFFDKLSSKDTAEQREGQSTSVDLGNGITLEMVTIPGGSFLMGTKDEEIERLCKEGKREKFNTAWFDYEKPQHEVKIESFSMGKYLITQEQWVTIMGKNPSHFKEANRPVERISWDDAIEFCKKLSQLTGQDYRLPSEAEWEYACRAGTTTAYSFGDNLNLKLANYGYGANKSLGETTRVIQYPPNSFGLYDLHGNVWEWCADSWHNNYEGAPLDGSAWLDLDSNNVPDDVKYVLRGGSWDLIPWLCRSATRFFNLSGTRSSDIGFRVACSVSRTL